MMKEVETGKKLKHVHCNDRSAPVIPKSKAKGQFVYDSEKENVHNQLLKQIQQGVRLKTVKTNDRSRPVLEGLRKFRRQMTIEEQIQKSASVADVVAAAAEPDELDDIDKVRDDLQSTKQMLALELRNKEALERENKRLMARLLNLEAELEKGKAAQNILKEKGNIVQMRTEDDDKLIQKLKEEATESSKMAKDMEDMYHKTAEELDITRAKLECAWLRNTQLEMDLKTLETHGNVPITKQPSKKLVSSISNAKLHSEPSSEEVTEEEETETETEEDFGLDDVAESAAQQEKRVMRELKLFAAKLRTLKEKRSLALKEKNNLKEYFSKLHKTLKEEKKKYKELQREVDKMAKLMKDVDEEDAENEEQEDDNQDNNEEDTESESESEESEGGESEGDLPESATNEDKISNFNRRIKVYETRLTTLKKSNYLLKANIDRRQDDLNRQKEMSLTLQEDLNSVLAELG
ncbi:hypothetical protein AAG570_013018 [Ranatra chinensis]|uniref:WH2 domain-containing protein n=1 Tax=Ranatra chinensis TaxID=642074 RepID=A0ABD0YY05_9HEMI